MCIPGAGVAALVVVFIWIAFVTCGCSPVRIFEKKVPVADSVSPVAQIEGQRQAAAYIAKRTAPPVANAPAAVADVHEVAVSLSASLGEPERPVEIDDRAAVISALGAGLREKEKQLERWKAFGRKYGGQPIEGTGINLAAGALWLWILAIVAACVFIPGFGWVLLRLVPVLWSAVKRGAVALEHVASMAPAAVAEAKAELPQAEDAVRKIIRRAKAGVNGTVHKRFPVVVDLPTRDTAAR